MTNDAQKLTSIVNYPGLLTNTVAQSGSGEPGAATVQTNVMGVRDGELTSRPGYKVVVFETD